jgi:hypothetical protein
MPTSHVNLSVFSADEAEAAFFKKCPHQIQRTDLRPESKSAIELAHEIDECPTDVRFIWDKLTQRI